MMAGQPSSGAASASIQRASKDQTGGEALAQALSQQSAAAAEIEYRVKAVLNKLRGPVPEPVNTKSTADYPNGQTAGLMNQYRDSVDSLRDTLQRTSHLLNDLETLI